MTSYDAEDQAVYWSLREVADAATEIPAEAQTPRLRDALTRLVATPPTQADEED